MDLFQRRLIAVADRASGSDIPLALLYLLPIVMMSTALKRWQIVLLGVFWLILTIIAALKANEGLAYRYPFSVRLVK